MSRLLQDYLADSVARRPEQVAVVAGEAAITYAQLDELSDKLAALLMDNDVAEGDRVGLYLPKSIESIVGVFGILKIGAVYVPVDPDAPPTRVAYILGNCDVKCVITSSAKMGLVRKALTDPNAVSVVVVMDATEPITQTMPAPIFVHFDTEYERVTLEPRQTGSDDLAYILYTSGSTGQPKGVMITHTNARTFVEWASGLIPVRADDRLSSHAPLHFDLSIFDVFATIKAGATLVLVPPGLSVFPYRLAEWIEKQRISIWYSVPSILSMLVRQGDIGRLDYSNLRVIIFAGEVFPPKYLHQLMTLVPHAEFYNWYGPTETNVITAHKVASFDPAETAGVPIGKACEGYDVFAITDAGRRVTVAGQSGELYASGPCVARGYWGDAEKTSRSFVPHPLENDSGKLAYRTGDFVTLDENGDFMFTGRRDHMIKSRGYRIELGEIEAVLYSHDDVEEAAVIAVPDEVVSNRIRAFVALRKTSDVTSDELRDFCQQRIPRYMVPEGIDLRNGLPKTSTGKVDKVRLAQDVKDGGGA